VVVDLRGNDLTTERPSAIVARDFEDGDIHRFLERPGFDAAMLKTMLDTATEQAETRSAALKGAAQEKAVAALTADVQRLLDLRKINDHVRPEEIALAQEQLERTRAAIAQARLRLDALRLILEGGE
jgi:ATP-dependent helicase HepA